MQLLIIGFIIGIVMAITGAGGALIAIPLFMHLLGLGLKEASVLSLIAVVLASGINFLPLRRDASVRISAIMFIAGFGGSYLSLPLKGLLTDLMIASLLAAISIAGLAMIWKKKSSIELQETKAAPLIPVLITGFFIGVLTTLTGLGGGVLLMPVLVGPFGLVTKIALPTSLLTICLTALASLAIQVGHGFSLPSTSSLIYLSFGILGSALMVITFSKRMNESLLQLIRKIVFTAVVFIAILKIFKELL